MVVRCVCWAWRPTRALAAIAGCADDPGEHRLPVAINTWYAAYAPAKTPKPIIDRLNAAFNKALKIPISCRRRTSFAIELIDDSTPDSAKKFYDDQMAFWDPIIKKSGANRN